ncbi:hypothetical protein [Actinomycetospora chiangmaiensis]|uniref:hypothetical protein n=1 Tax=Actinomycetospora chiangmaiensis TaxID=402650 RepID=UPI000362C32F|nr:hypothetical protein [Actinomycetospora chiangmaiensis]
MQVPPPRNLPASPSRAPVPPIRATPTPEHDDVHPVIEILRARRERGDRDDGYRVALAIEGGGARATLSGGMALGSPRRCRTGRRWPRA